MKQSQIQKLLLLATLVTATSLSSIVVQAWSIPSLTKQRQQTQTQTCRPSSPAREDDTATTLSSDAAATMNRRQLVRNSVATAFSLVVVSSLDTTSTTSANANAACIQGDLSPSCIGEKKIPYDNTNKFLAKIRGVKPITNGPTGLLSAIGILREQRSIADEQIRQNIVDNELEQAGIKLLQLIPYVTRCCYCVCNDLDDMSAFTKEGLGGKAVIGMAIPSRSIEIAKQEATELNAVWCDFDVVISKGIKGELGDPEQTQEIILASLKVALKTHDSFLGSAEAYSRI